MWDICLVIRQVEVTLTPTEKHVVRISNASNDLLRIMDQKTVDAVVKSVRNALDNLWNYMACKDATFAIKDASFGQSVKAGKTNEPFDCHTEGFCGTHFLG